MSATFDVVGFGPNTKAARLDAIDVLAQLTGPDDRLWRIEDERYSAKPGADPKMHVLCHLFVEVDERKTEAERMLREHALQEYEGRDVT